MQKYRVFSYGYKKIKLSSSSVVTPGTPRKADAPTVTGQMGSDTPVKLPVRLTASSAASPATTLPAAAAKGRGFFPAANSAAHNKNAATIITAKRMSLTPC